MRLEDGIQSAAAGGRILERELEILTDNLANIDTAGFKRERMRVGGGTFPLLLDEQMRSVPGPESSGSYVDWSKGPIFSTGNPLDVALRSNAFLMVETPNGIGYTRDGRLSLGSGGELVRQDGLPILDASGGRIVLPAGSARISEDGSIQVGDAAVGKIGAVEFPEPASLVRDGEGVFRAAAGIEPTPSAAPGFEPGYLEASNVNAARSVVELVRISRTYEAMLRAVRAMDSALGRGVEGKTGG